MKKYQTLILLAFAIIQCFNTEAQDVLFSQFEKAPLLLNSALTGNLDEAGRISLNYRDQWRPNLKNAAYKTGALSFDYKLPLGKTQYVGVGVSSFFDRAGQINYGRNQVNLHAALIKILGDVTKAHHTLALGFGYGLAKLQASNEGIYYSDLSSGLIWTYKTKSRFSFQIGSSIHHLNKPDISVYPTNIDRLNRRVNVHGNFELPILKQISIIPGFLFATQAPHEQLLVGLDGQYKLSDQKPNKLFSQVKLGYFIRSGQDVSSRLTINSMIFRASLDSRKFELGLSYDHYLNGLNAAFEIVLGYKLGAKKLN